MCYSVLGCTFDHRGNTANTMTEADWLSIGEGTHGYSGADMSILVRDALMEPIRTLQVCTQESGIEGDF